MPAIFGLQGLYAVELVQLWRITLHPVKDAMALIGRLFLFLIVGLLPDFNNFSNIGGFIFGVLSSIALLKPVTFSKADAQWKRKIRFVAVFLFVALSTLLLVFFHLYQDAMVCRVCENLNCIPLTNNFCTHLAGPDPLAAILYGEKEIVYYRKHLE